MQDQTKQTMDEQKSTIDDLNNTIRELKERIKELGETVEYLEYLIEWCECGNPKADCVCEHQNGWHNSKEYKLLAELRSATKVIESLNECSDGAAYTLSRDYLSTLPPEIKELLED